MQKRISQKSLSRSIRIGMRKARASGIRLGRPPKVTAAQVEQVTAMYADGSTLRQIAEVVGLSRGTVHNIVRKGIKRNAPI